MSFNFHNHKMRMLATEEKPVSYSAGLPFKFFVPDLTPNTTFREPVEQALLRARAKIAAGWLQGTIRGSASDGAMAYCARGALIEEDEDGFDHFNLRAEEYLYRALPSDYSMYTAARQGDVIAYYNDLYETTQADILALYDRAVQLAHAEGA